MGALWVIFMGEGVCFIHFWYACRQFVDVLAGWGRRGHLVFIAEVCFGFLFWLGFPFANLCKQWWVGPPRTFLLWFLFSHLNYLIKGGVYKVVWTGFAIVILLLASCTPFRTDVSCIQCGEYNLENVMRFNLLDRSCKNFMFVSYCSALLLTICGLR